MTAVAALYIDPLGIYPKLLGDGACWDAARNALSYKGPHPIVAHPACGPWGKLRHMYRGGEGGPELAPAAVAQVRRWGGVLEHPEGSKLWGGPSCLNRRGALPGAVADLPFPGDPPDAWGGFTIKVDQVEWGHVARKSTWLYIVGVSRETVAALVARRPYPGRAPTHWIAGRHKAPTAEQKARWSKSSRASGLCPKHIKICSGQQRRRTPPLFAEFLISIARLAAHSRAEVA